MQPPDQTPQHTPRPHYATAACSIGLHSECWIREPKLASLAAINGCDCVCHQPVVSDQPGEGTIVRATPAEKLGGPRRATGTSGTQHTQGADAERQIHVMRLFGAGYPVERIAAETGYSVEALRQLHSAVAERMMIDTFLGMGRKKGDPHDHE